LGATALAAPFASPLAAATHEEFETAVKTALAPLAGKSISGLKVVYVSNDIGPWLDTGLEVKAGERITTIVQGRIVWSKALDITIPPGFAVWSRIGDKGAIFRGTRDTNTVTASGDGKLYLKTMPGRWLDKTGRYDSDPAPVNPDWGGGASVAIIKWAPAADIETELKGLASAAEAPAWAAAELDRMKTSVLPPKGWSYLWDLGPSETYKEVTGSPGDKGPARRIALRTLNDAAILHRDAETDLTPDTRLAWSWKAVALPAATREDAFPTHDYMSIAVEFDNGQDLTYIWSHSLPVGQSFRCPIPSWHDRETHMVVRSGTADLNTWMSESRNVFEDYKAAIGGEMPKRVKRVWLIAVSLFRHGEGKSEFGDMRLTSGAGTINVW
jgi:hypothetical protein